jgi:DNA-binding GntR family transcriptional regulator
MKSKERDLTGEACAQIKQMILNYELKPGEKLEHQALSDQLGMSRTPVREALGRLTEEGFVSRIPHRGYSVPEITENEASELFDLRECLELYSVERAINRATPEDLIELQSILDAYRLSVLQGVTRRMFLVDQNFHLKIAEIGGGSALRRILTTIFEKIIMKRRMEGISPLSGLESYRRHLKILTAIKNHNLRSAQEQIKEHVRAGKEAVLEQIDQREAAAGVEAAAGGLPAER